MRQRVFDIGVAAPLLLVAIPLMLAAALVIFLNSPGSVFYRAPRVGKDGRVFTMLKLRTMRTRDVSKQSAITAHDDPRVIPAAKWVRRSRIDELPQLYHVIKGDMSIVGTRPRDPSIFRQYDTPLYREAFQRRPGLTSPGSLYSYMHAEKTLVNYAEAEKTYVSRVLPVILALDVTYMRGASFGKDLRLILRTLTVIAGFGGLTAEDESEYEQAHSYLRTMVAQTADGMYADGGGC